MKVVYMPLIYPLGTVIRVSTVKLLEYEREYICCRCKQVFGVKADFEQFYSIPKPTKCPSSKECNSNKFNSLSDGGKPLNQIKEVVLVYERYIISHV